MPNASLNNPVGGRSYAGFNPARREDVGLFAAVLQGDHVARGFRNRDVREAVFGNGKASGPPQRTSAAVGRMLKRLRVLQLVAKVPRTRRWKVTEPGRILVALWLYATLEVISSAHEVEQRCWRDDCFKWICGGISVNYHTLADFRTDHADWLEQQVVHSVAVLRREGLGNGWGRSRARSNIGSAVAVSGPTRRVETEG